jgi:DNA-directed RNA polymerase subunit E'/Rpb7
MSEIVVLEKKISIESEFLYKNLKDHLFNKLKKIYENECTKDNGYFLKINKILKIKDNFISSNCENIFNVEFEAETLKPEIGKKIQGIVCMIFSGGIFINVENMMKILIPESNLKEYKFYQTETSFKYKNNIIKKDDIITVCISGVKYSKKKFSCFGTL